MDADHELKIRAARDRFNYFSDKIELACIGRRGEDLSAAEPLTIRPIDEHTTIPSFITINKNQAQLLMDDLWDCGLRPSEGSGSAGAMKAVQNHLADVKKILFHKLGIKE